MTANDILDILKSVITIENRLLRVLVCCLLVIWLSGCSSLRHIAQSVIGVGSATKQSSLPSYSGPRASLTVADFEVKTTKASFEIGSNLREMLVSALLGSNRFNFIEFKAPITAKEAANTIAAEGGLESSATGQKEKAKTADLIVTVVVADFEPQLSGGRAGLGGGGGVGSGILGGLLGQALQKAYLALNIRIVDASTSSILAESRILGQASDIAGEKMDDEFGHIGLVGGLAAYTNTPMEKAIRMCVTEAARYVRASVSQSYYKD